LVTTGIEKLVVLLVLLQLLLRLQSPKPQRNHLPPTHGPR